MRRRTKYLAPPLIFLSADVAAADLSGEIGFVSDYRDRGVSQSAEAVAVQAALDLDITEAWRLSAWASSLRDNPLGDAEINLSASYAGGLGLMGFWVAGVQGALFPGGPGGDHVELYGTLGLDYGLLVPSLGVTYAPSNNDGTGANLYAQARVDAAWPGKPYGAIFSAGFDHFERARDKWDWSAGLFY
ncbi:MAG: hypothetical protein D6782_05685, partial [Alphaproteobacteria bacterium]